MQCCLLVGFYEKAARSDGKAVGWDGSLDGCDGVCAEMLEGKLAINPKAHQHRSPSQDRLKIQKRFQRLHSENNKLMSGTSYRMFCFKSKVELMGRIVGGSSVMA